MQSEIQKDFEANYYKERQAHLTDTQHLCHLIYSLNNHQLLFIDHFYLYLCYYLLS